MTRTARLVLLAGAAALPAPAAFADALDAVIESVTGHYAKGDATLHAVRVDLAHTEDAVYMELVEKNFELSPTQLIATFHETDRGVVARLMSYPPVFGDILAMDLATLTNGLWAAPEHFPALLPGQLMPLGETLVDHSDDRVSIEVLGAPNASATTPVVDLRLSFSDDAASWQLTGRDRNGAELWSDAHADMQAIEPERRVSERNGLVIIDIREGQGVTVENGNLVAAHYVATLQDGRRIDATFAFPGKTMISGDFPDAYWAPLAEGMRGMACPTTVTDETVHHRPIRKIIIPPQLGYGAERTGPVPPNSTLYYFVHVQSALDRSEKPDR
jgi:hypothetical protein